MILSICHIKHKWEYYQEEHMVYTKWHSPNKVETFWVRRCIWCDKKQKASLGFGTYNFKLGKYCRWSSWSLSKKEIRESVLRELGI